MSSAPGILSQDCVGVYAQKVKLSSDGSPQERAAKRSLQFSKENNLCYLNNRSHGPNPTFSSSRGGCKTETTLDYILVSEANLNGLLAPKIEYDCKYAHDVDHILLYSDLEFSYTRKKHRRPLQYKYLREALISEQADLKCSHFQAQIIALAGLYLATGTIQQHYDAVFDFFHEASEGTCSGQFYRQGGNPYGKSHWDEICSHPRNERKSFGNVLAKNLRNKRAQD